MNRSCKCYAVPISANKNVALVLSSRFRTVADRSSFASKHEHSLHEWVHSGICKEFSWMQAGETGVLVMSVNRRNLGREQTKYPKEPKRSKSSTGADDLSSREETARTSLVTPRPTDPPSVLKEGDVLLEVRVARKSLDEAFIFAEHMQTSKLKANNWSKPYSNHACAYAEIIRNPEGIDETHAMHAGRKIQGGQFWSSQDAICLAQIEHPPHKPPTDTGSLSSPSPAWYEMALNTECGCGRPTMPWYRWG